MSDNPFNKKDNTRNFIFEIFENGESRTQHLNPCEDFYDQIFTLTTKITKSDPETIIQYILTDICFLTKSTNATIWNFSKKEMLIKQNDFQIETKYIKNFASSSSSKKNIISDDILLDRRFKKRMRLKKLKTKTTLSLPLVLKKEGKAATKFEKQCLAILQLSDDFQLVLESDKCHTLENIEQIYHLAMLLVKFVKATPPIMSINESEKPILALKDTFYRSDSSESETFSLEKQKEKDNIKDIFLAAVSHDLRTPLNGIVGMITMLRDAGPINEKQQTYLTILMECCHQLMNMMNNILDFSKINSKRFVLIKGSLDIKKAVKDASLMIEGKAQTKNIKYKVTQQENIPILIGDMQRLTQIITNLLSNAVKYTDKGYISLSVTGEETKEMQNYVKKWRITFEVRDSGIGISKIDHERIFKIFDQGTHAITRNGTGLGLTVSKELAKLMGGDIEVYSSGIKGEGSLFRFHIISEEEINPSHLSDEDSENLRNSKILVVDDRAEYRMQLTDMLFKWGCRPMVVCSGEEALLMISHTEKFDIILVDICMEYMSGIQLAQELRGNPTTKNIYLIALSSVELAVAGGVELFDFYMNKPINQNALLPVLINAAKKKILNDVPVHTNIKKNPKKNKTDLKILIAEDDKNNSFTIKEMLFYLGFNIDNMKIVEDGQKCVAEVRKRQYDVVLMDIKMFPMDGLEATKHIRQMNPRPYIIAVSAAVQASDKQRCQQVGIDSYLAKPVLKEKLMTALTPLILD